MPSLIQRSENHWSLNQALRQTREHDLCVLVLPISMRFLLALNQPRSRQIGRVGLAHPHLLADRPLLTDQRGEFGHAVADLGGDERACQSVSPGPAAQVEGVPVGPWRTAAPTRPVSLRSRHEEVEVLGVGDLRGRVDRVAVLRGDHRIVAERVAVKPGGHHDAHGHLARVTDAETRRRRRTRRFTRDGFRSEGKAGDVVGSRRSAWSVGREVAASIQQLLPCTALARANSLPTAAFDRDLTTSPAFPLAPGTHPGETAAYVAFRRVRHRDAGPE